MRVHVPTSVIENKYEAYPEGSYDGAIGSASLRDPNGDGSWLTLKVGVTGITAKEGTNDPGRNRFQSDITIETDGQNVFEVENFNDENLDFRIKRAGGLLAGLAIGLGMVTSGDSGADVDLREVAEALIDGQFEGEAVGFEVGHWTGQDKVARDQYVAFGHSG